MAISQYFLQELKQRNDIESIAAPYVDLKRRGKNLVGLCPFHNEKTPSFNIYPENGSFFCFGCNTGGDVITFVMRSENLDYIEAVRFLAQRAGMQMPDDGVDDTMSKLRTRILEVNRETARFFHAALMSKSGSSVLDYFRRRGLSMETIKHFGLGYSPPGGFALVNHLKAKGYTPTEMVQANVAGMSKNGNAYDRFKNRAMFPIIDLRGNVVAFGGRILTNENPKYINTSDTLVYHKSSGLFAMNFAKDSGQRQLILAEGYMDVIALHQAGFTNAVASLGTSLTEEQARIIARYADEIVICYDSDEAGQRATQRAIPILKKTGLFVKVLTVPGNKDPDEFMRSHGAEGSIRFRDLLENSGNDVEYRLYKIQSKYNIETSEGKVKYLQEAVEVIASLDDMIARDVYASKLSVETDVGKSAILEMAEKSFAKIAKKRRQEERKAHNEVFEVSGSLNTEKRNNMRAAVAEEGIIAYIMNNPDKAKLIESQLPSSKFVTAFNRRVYELLLGKTMNNEVSLTDFAGELTSEEMSQLTRITVKNQQAPPSADDVREYIKLILSDAGFSNPERIKTASTDEIMEQFDLMRKQKSRGNE